MDGTVFTIYTMGDVEIFRAALVGVSMIFSPSGMFGGTGAVGLGALVGFGLLISLTMMLFTGIMKQKMEIGELIVLIIAFTALFVPKFDVQIESYLGEDQQIAKVDNVPLGVVFPAAMMSTITKNVNDVVATAYSTVDGGAYTNIQSPLRILNGLRKGALALNGVAPTLSANLKAYAIFCMAGKAGFDLNQFNATKVNNFQNMLEALSSRGLTLDYRTDPAGTLTTCDDMRGYLFAGSGNSGFDAFMYGPEFREVLNSAAGVTKPSGSTPGQMEPLKFDDYEGAFKALTGGNNSTAYNFALMTLFTPVMNGAIHCAPNVANNADLAQCLSWATALPQWSQDSAAGGSFFQRIMMHGMNALLFLFFCLSPVVAIVMLMTGAKGLKIAAAYLLFGAWSQSWFVGASIINFYIQKQLQYELQMNGGVGNLTASTIGPFFDSIQIKMGLAGDMLSSVPLLMMAILSGSVYGLTSLAGRWGSRDYHDEKVNAPSLVQSAALHSNQGMNGQRFNSATGVDETIGGGASIALGHTFKADETASIQAQRRASESLANSINHKFGEDIKTSEGRSRLTKLADGLEASGAHEQAAQLRHAITGSEKHTIASGKDDKSLFSLDGNLKASIPVGGKAGGGAAGAAAGMGATRQYTFNTGDKNEGGVAGDTAASDDIGDTSRTGNNLSWDQIKQIGNAYEKAYGENTTLTDGKTWSAERSEVEAATQSTSTSQMFGSKREISSAEFTTMVRDRNTGGLLTDAQMAFSGKDGPNGDLYRQAFQSAGIEYRGLNGTAQFQMQQYRALEAVAMRGTGAEQAEAQRQLKNVMSQTAGQGFTPKAGAGSLRAGDHGHITSGATTATKSAGGLNPLDREKAGAQARGGANLARDVPQSKGGAQPLINGRAAENDDKVDRRVAPNTTAATNAGKAAENVAAITDPRSSQNPETGGQSLPGPVGDRLHKVANFVSSLVGRPPAGK